MRTAIITALNADGKTELLCGELPFSEAKELSDKLRADPPAGYTDGVLWISDMTSRAIKWTPKETVKKSKK